MKQILKLKTKKNLHEKDKQNSQKEVKEKNEK